MNNPIPVIVDVEYSASHIKRFHETVPATCTCPQSQAIANVANRLIKEGDHLARHHNYYAY